MNADTLDAEEWQRALAALPIASRDVYFTPEYHNLHVANGDGDAVCVAVRDADAVLLVPGLRRPVPVTAGPPRAPACWDLESCNGYGGPLVTPGVRAAFLQDAWVETRRALGESGGVAAFFRLHPLVGNELLLPSDAIVQNDRPTVYVDLTHGLEQAWDRAESRHRNMVRKGRREGIAVCWNDPGDWSHFEALYGDAMTRLSAPERLFQLGTEDFPPLNTLHETNLPVPATRFLGREREIDAIAMLLRRPEVRLVTLTGPGGSGKTRLSLQAAAAAADEYEHGVWWVPLASVADARLVETTAAQALGSKDTLSATVGDKRLLLVLDNFEHLLDAADRKSVV